METRREETGPVTDSMLQGYQELQVKYAELESLYRHAQDRIAELEAEARKDKPEPPPK